MTLIVWGTLLKYLLNKKFNFKSYVIYYEVLTLNPLTKNLKFECTIENISIRAETKRKITAKRF